jgi:ferrochelatase
VSDGVLIAGFGGPAPGCCGRRAGCRLGPDREADCFVNGILGDDPALSGRAAEVVAHYRHFGGLSPYNRLAAAQTDALRGELRRRGRQVQVELGFRHWSPTIADACSRLAVCTRVAGLILAPHGAGRSTEAYKAATPRADVGWTASFHDHPGMADAIAARLRQATLGWSAERLARAALVFTAHAIPQPAERASGYRSLVETSARLAAAAFAKPDFRLAFQSAPGASAIPWSTPTVSQTLDQLQAGGTVDVLLQPIGFVVDHMEVLYDLDVEAQLHAGRIGLQLTRAATVGEHPAFIAALADRCEQILG